MVDRWLSSLWCAGGSALWWTDGSLRYGAHEAQLYGGPMVLYYLGIASWVPWFIVSGRPMYIVTSLFDGEPV